MNDNRLQYLDAMGISAWALRNNNTSPELEQDFQEQWGDLQACVKNCCQCGLEKTRKNTVFGIGNPHADLMIIGEAPGAREDQQGLPFVGRAGMLLTQMLKAIDIERDDIFICNILKCRPPNNRDPLPYEVDCCTPYLTQQIALIQPKLIIAVGRIAAQFLLKTTSSLGRLRGKTYSYGEQETPLLATYHPAYLLRNPKDKSKAYEDLLLIQKNLISKNC